MRDAANGWLQGFITMTTFTTWSADFEWDSSAPESGLPAARLANARLRNGESVGHDATVHVAGANETVSQVATNLGMDVAELISLNAATFPQISARSKVRRSAHSASNSEASARVSHAVASAIPQTSRHRTLSLSPRPLTFGP